MPKPTFQDVIKDVNKREQVLAMMRTYRQAYVDPQIGLRVTAHLRIPPHGRFLFVHHLDSRGKPTKEIIKP